MKEIIFYLNKINFNIDNKIIKKGTQFKTEFLF